MEDEKEVFDRKLVLGLCRQLVHDGRVRAGGVGSVGKSVSDKMKFWDDLSGEELEPELVEAARCEEMEEYRKHGVYKKVPLEECWEETGKDPIGTIWVDTNNGCSVSPNHRSRWVAKEFKGKNGSGSMLYR